MISRIRKIRPEPGMEEIMQLGIRLHDTKKGTLEERVAIAEEQVLADDSVQDFVYIFAGFDGHESFVVDSLIRYIQGIQKIIYAYFFFKPSGGIGRTSGFKG